MIRILIADDHAIVREGLKQIVAKMKDMCVIGEAGNWPDLIELVRKQVCDVILLDVNMPADNGMSILKQLKTDNPQIPVLMLSMYSEQQYALRALKAGADGYISKTSSPETLIGVIRQVFSGRKYISSTLTDELIDHLVENTDRDIHEKLSKREFQVMRKLAVGKTVGQISKEMHLSIKTISTFRTRTLKKMHMKTNAELIHYAIKKRLVEERVTLSSHEKPY